MDAVAKKCVALVALDLELELVAFDLGDPRRHDDGASRRGRRQMSHMDFVADRCVTCGQQAFYRAMTGDLHQSDHGRGRERAFAADVVGEQFAFNDAFEPPFQARANPLDRVHEINCRS